MSEINAQLEQLREVLSDCSDGNSSLEAELESAAKHVPAYIKIVKSHIDQLATVLQSENHDNKTLESINLATPVVQLIELFDKLQEDDIHQLESLAIAAKNWQPEHYDGVSVNNEITTQEEASAS